VIRKHNRCRGIRVWKWNSFQIEVWFLPKGEWIEPHVHNRIDSRIVLLFGHMTGRIGRDTGYAKPWKAYQVPAGMLHSATADTFCIFANVERWQGEPTSAAEDFTAV
jgi:mannose-6-phosphate isomerase-like protein (cupin superfamily)